MHSFATEHLSGVIHNRNGDNIANVVAKLVEKTDGTMAGKYGCVLCPLHSRSGYDPEDVV